MLSAREAKEITLESDSGLHELIEEIEELIKDEAEGGFFDVEVDITEVEDFLLDKLEESLKEAGYIVQRSELIFKINWRLA